MPSFLSTKRSSTLSGKLCRHLCFLVVEVNTCFTTAFACHNNVECNLWVHHGKNMMLLLLCISIIKGVFTHVSKNMNFVLHSKMQCWPVFWFSPGMSSHVQRMSPYLLTFYFLEKGLSMAQKYLTVTLYMSSDVPFYGYSFKKLEEVLLPVKAADWNLFLIAVLLNHTNTISWWESLMKHMRYSTYKRYCVVWAMFHAYFHKIYMHIFWFQNMFSTWWSSCHTTNHHHWLGGEGEGLGREG